MELNRTHKIRLYPNNKQRGYFLNACGVSRFVYNWGLAEWKHQYENGENPSAYGLKKQFNAIKKAKFPFVYNVTKCASEQPFIDLGMAFNNFFCNIKNGRKPGFPRFKKKGKKDSFYLSNDQFRLESKKIYIPKLDWIRMAESLRFEGKVLSARVSRTADIWFVSVSVELDIEPPSPFNKVIGVDVGVNNLAVVSDGRVFENPKSLTKQQLRLRLLNKALSRKKKGSKNRKKAIIRLAKLHWKIANIRNESLHQASTAITKGSGLIGIEDLHIKGLLKNHRLSKALSDAALSELLRRIEYKAVPIGAVIVKADRFFPSTKLCPVCGELHDMPLSKRMFECGCGWGPIDRDLNASINLERLAAGSAVSAYRLGSAGFTALAENETSDWVGISHKDVS